MKSRDDLERDANFLLYGDRDVVEAANFREVFSVPIAPRRQCSTYIAPKKSQYCGDTPRCEVCKNPRSWSAGRLCKRCFSTMTRQKFAERVDGIGWLEQMNEPTYQTHEYATRDND